MQCFRRSVLLCCLFLIISVFSLFNSKIIRAETGLVGWWKLDEDSGMLIRDYSGFGDEGSVEGFPIWIPGRFGRAFMFRNFSYIRLLYQSRLAIRGNLTLSLWFNSRILERRFTYPLVAHVGKGERESQNALYSLKIFNKAIEYTHEYGAGKNVTFDFDRVPPLSDSKWYHVVIIRDVVAKQIKYYLDGQLQATKSYEFNPTGGRDGHLEIGRNIGFIPEIFFSGYMDDIRIYNRLLTDQEVANLFSLASLTPSVALSMTPSAATPTAVISPTPNPPAVSIQDVLTHYGEVNSPYDTTGDGQVNSLDYAKIASP